MVKGQGSAHDLVAFVSFAYAWSQCYNVALLQNGPKVDVFQMQ